MIHTVSPGFFMTLFNLQRIEYNPDSKMIRIFVYFRSV
jgi:hypothetical protein